ncbi:MAG: L-seryl-tRNA(Sec) selenium transferase [Proteobacteria bacterium]|nr:L-seryl-tRNA(Sec) selenium transferase [Pseudomonadota bacterium]
MQQSQFIFSKIPPIQEIDQYLEDEGVKHGKEVRNTIQKLLISIRRDIDWLSDANTTRQSILERIKTELEQNKQELTQVINGTGAIIHTNLGRSVFDRELLDDVSEIASSYTNLEFSLETGKRGARLSNVGGLLKTLTGAEEVVVVNNNAAGVLLSLITLAKGHEVVISRGELVEIGGSFRIPEIIEVSGATLKEVGTTNRTRLQDYEAALTENTAVLLKVHTSNYQVLGFTESTPTLALSHLAKQNGVLVMEDLGSGALTGFQHSALNSEPLVPQVLKDGVDLVTISGDKLLGGPQAGIILGKKHILDKIRKHPLYRALRCDKITMLLLEKTLVSYANNQQHKMIPTQRMLNEPADLVHQRAEGILSKLDKKTFKLVECSSTPGGGSLPGKAIPSWGILLQLTDRDEDQILAQLRRSKPPVIGRIIDGSVIIDCRTVLPHQENLLVSALKALEG